MVGLISTAETLRTTDRLVDVIVVYCLWFALFIRSFDFLISEAPELMQDFLEKEQDASCKRNAFMMLIHVDQVDTSRRVYVCGLVVCVACGSRKGRWIISRLVLTRCTRLVTFCSL